MSKDYGLTFLSPVKREAIITALGNGESIRSIGRNHHVSLHTVYSVAESDKQQIAALKDQIITQSRRNAFLAGERITNELESSKHIPLPALNMTFGVNVDKFLALTGQPSLTVAHQHEHIHAHISEDSYTDLLSKLPRRSPTVIDVTPTDSPS